MTQDWAAVGQLLRARRQELGMSQPAVAAGLADEGVNVDKSMVSRWEAGEKISEPHYVFALERVLECGPGDLSRRVGYLPLDAVPAVTVEDAIRQDQRLSRVDRELVVAYRQALIDRSEAQRSRRTGAR